MPGGFGSPYREPSNGVDTYGWADSPPVAKGGCYQHTVLADKAVPKYANITTVSRHCEGGSFAPEPHQALASTFPSCTSGGCVECDSDTKGCGPWLMPPDRPTIGSHYSNIYASDPAGTEDRSRCRKLGHKSVQARKSWHGCHGFLSNDRNGFGGTMQEYVVVGGVVFSCNFEPERTTPDDTKYRTMVSSGSYSFDLTVGNPDFGECDTPMSSAEAVSSSITVNRYSGIRTGSYASSFSGDSSNASNAMSFAIQMNSINKETMGSYWIGFVGVIQGLVSDCGMEGGTATISFSGSPRNPSMTASTSTPLICGSFSADASIDYDAGTYSASRTIGTTEVGRVIEYTETITLTATTAYLNKHTTDTLTGCEQVTEIDFTGTATLSDSYTSDQVHADLDTLLDEWPLNDDRLLPWRTDEQSMIAPLVTYREDGGRKPFVVEVIDGSSGSYTDGDAGFFTGAMQGSPLTAGYGPHFDFDHETRRQCDDGGCPPAGCYYSFEWGAFASESGAFGQEATDGLVPPNCTQWTSNASSSSMWAGDMPPSAWFIYVGLTAVAYKTKYAEIKIPRPSINYFRPAVLDRWAVDEPTVRCVTGIAGDTYTLDSDTTIETGDNVIYCDGSGGIGVYPVTMTDAHMAVLGTKICDATDLGNCYGEYGAMIGKARFFDTAWPVGGRNKVISAVQSGGDVIVTLEDDTTLIVGDHVDFTGVGGLGSNVAVTMVTSAKVFKVTGTLTTLSDPANIIAHGAPSYEWYDDKGKGQYLKVEWDFNFRDVAERDRVINSYNGTPADCGGAVADPDPPIRTKQSLHGMPREVSDFSVEQHCLPFTPCHPQVFCFSPNGEDWDNGETFAMPTKACDTRYGSRWQGAFVQQMTDPFWQPLRSPSCDETSCPQQEDFDGGCLEDTCDEEVPFHFYPMRPYKEAMAAVPDGAPALPTGCFVGFLGLADLDTTGDVAGNVLPPPVTYFVTPDSITLDAVTYNFYIFVVGGMGYLTAADDPYLQPLAYDYPWGDYLRQVGCVCDGDRFATIYQERDGVKINCPS